MAASGTLKVRGRSEQGKGVARKLRAEGRIPAVLYGHGEPTRLLSVNAHEVGRLFSHISVENTVLTLEPEEGGAPVRALVREVQSHPGNGRLLHVDFFQIHAGERIDVDVPIRLVGAARGVREGGVMDQVLYDMHIRCVADRIPEAIEVDVSEVGIGESVHVRDLVLPPEVTPQHDPDVTICTIAPPTVASAPASPEPGAGVGGDVQPEVIRRRPDDDGEG